MRMRPLPERLRLVAEDLYGVIKRLDGDDLVKVGAAIISLQLMADQVEDGTAQYDGPVSDGH